MKVIRIEDAKKSLGEYAAASEEAVVVTSDGGPIAALMPLDGADFEPISLSTTPKFVRIIEQSRKRQRKQGSISSDEMRGRLGIRCKRLG